jgi:succinate-acetate transporter protein
MAQFASTNQAGVEHVDTAEATSIANPVPLGMSALAFTTAILGCSFAGFIVPGVHPGVVLAVAAALFYGGIVQILAGMWEFKKANTFAATLFSSYGGFLVAFGVVFIPGFGIANVLNSTGTLHQALGLFFLCWTIFSGVLFLGSLRSGVALPLILLALFLSFLFLTIGQLASANLVLLAIGGWIGVACALIAWYATLAMMVNMSSTTFRLPLGRWA